MTTTALLLVLAAACCHASWNFLTKRVAGGPSFVWLFSLVACVVYLPVTLWWLWDEGELFTPMTALFCGLNALLHTAYFLLLQRGYKTGQLSLVYPVARATGPVLVIAAAMLLLDERPSVAALCGAAAIVLGTFFLTGGFSLRHTGEVRRSLRFGLLTGCVIACYTFADGYAVSALAIPPLMLEYSSNLLRVGLLTPSARKSRDEIALLWREHRWRVIGVGVLSPLAYILVLSAMAIAPLGYIAAAREISVLLVVLMGTFLLGEGQLLRRGLSAGVIMGGLALLTLN